MNQLKISLGSMALDLNRAAIGINRGSSKMAERFFQEALERKKEIKPTVVPTYIRQVLDKVRPDQNLDQNCAERLMVYSILLENFAVRML